MKPKIVTIGVYGFAEEAFFQSLLDAHVDTFCDIRRRRGMRGSLYAFVNSQHLQQRLQELGIRYVYCRELAPNEELRKRQKQEDKKSGVAKRKREALTDSFVQAYEQETLSDFDAQAFMQQLGEDAKIVSLFCVEREPMACHRSLLAKRLVHDLQLEIEDIKP